MIRQACGLSWVSRYKVTCAWKGRSWPPLPPQKEDKKEPVVPVGRHDDADSNSSDACHDKVYTVCGVPTFFYMKEVDVDSATDVHK